MLSDSDQCLDDNKYDSSNSDSLSTRYYFKN